jgi:hypothetical protein
MRARSIFPVRLFLVATLPAFGTGLLIQKRSSPDVHLHRTGGRTSELAPVLAHAHVIDREVEQMTSAVADIISTAVNPFTPIGVIELPIELHVRTPEPHLFSIDTRKIRLAADTRTEAHVQRVVPDVQLPHVGRVDGGDEIDRANGPAIRAGHLMRDVHDVLVRADAVEWRHDVVRQVRGAHFETESRMRRAADRALALGPTERIESEGWPMFVGRATRVDLLFESQEHQVTGLMRAKARDLDVVVQ